MSSTVKPGVRSSEFYVNSLTVLASFITAVDPAIHAQSYVKAAAFVVAGVVSVAYTFKRSGLKAAALEVVHDVEDVSSHASAS